MLVEALEPRQEMAGGNTLMLGCRSLACGAVSPWHTLTISSCGRFSSPPPDYLLSNNYVNSIIVHKFDFSDEEIMAYYISFLKTLSLKLNNHTVHFFYNEVSHSPRGVGLGSQLVRVALSMRPC